MKNTKWMSINVIHAKAKLDIFKQQYIPSSGVSYTHDMGYKQFRRQFQKIKMRISLNRVAKPAYLKTKNYQTLTGKDSSVPRSYKILSAVEKNHED